MKSNVELRINKFIYLFSHYVYTFFCNQEFSQHKNKHKNIYLIILKEASNEYIEYCRKQDYFDYSTFCL